MKVRKLRLLRFKYKIPLKALGDTIGVSKQRMSELELGEYAATRPVRRKVSNAIETVIAMRFISLSALERDFAKHKDSLFEMVEDDYEL